MTKRKLLIEIDCEDETCGACDRQYLSDSHCYCTQFGDRFGDKKILMWKEPQRNPLRCAECKSAEVTSASIGLALREDGPPLIMKVREAEPPGNLSAEYVDIGTGQKIDTDEPERWLRIKFEKEK